MSDGAPATPISRTPLGKSLVATRSVGLAVLGLVVVFGGGWYLLAHDDHPRPKASDLMPPQMAAPAGGQNHSDMLDRTMRDKEMADARAAEASHKSFASALATNDHLKGDNAPVIGNAPSEHEHSTPPPRGTSPPTEHHQDPPQSADGSNPFTRDPAEDASHGNHSTRGSRGASNGSLSDLAEAELFAAWSSHAPSLDVKLPSQGVVAAKQGSNGQAFTRTPAESGPETASTVSVSSGAPAASSGKSKRRPLVAAGRGVYGHAVLTANSDIGGQALVEIDSGALIHARVSGAFQRKDNFLVIKFDKLMIGDADPIGISAYAVSPDTAETGVASDVDEHIATRIILPTAAAFVEGLGNAMQNTNTSSYTSGVGLASFTHLTLPQQMGVAAGKAGQQLGQILQQATPQQATVWLRSGDPVGVVFQEPVFAPGE